MHAGDGCPTPPSSSGWHLGGRQQQVGVLRAWRSCSTTSSNRHPDDLEGAGVDYIHPGVRIPTRHTAHALPDKLDVFCSRHLNEQRSSYHSSWASLGKLGGLPQQAFGFDATRGQQASFTSTTRLQQQGCRAFASTRQNGAADKRSQIELMHVLVRTFVCV